MGNKDSMFVLKVEMERDSVAPILRRHSQNESDENAHDDGEDESPYDEEQCAPAADKVITSVISGTSLPCCAGVVNGEDSKEWVEEKAAHGEPHVCSWMFERCWSTWIGAGDDAALSQSSWTARCAVKAATAAALRLRLWLLARHQVARASAATFVTHLSLGLSSICIDV